jgi:Uma2 family endonuclease
MTLAVDKLAVPSRPEAGEAILLHNVAWETYEALLDDLDGQHLRLTYDNGRLAIVSPLPKHDKLKKLVGRMIEQLSLEHAIPVSSFGSTTWKRRKLRKGLEADECYYVQSEPMVRGREDLDLNKDPPPDLAVEVDVTHHPVDRMKVYAGLGVPEVWVCRVDRIRCMCLVKGRYRESENSLAFPFLKPADLERFLAMRSTVDETSLMRAFRDWVVKAMKKR